MQNARARITQLAVILIIAASLVIVLVLAKKRPSRNEPIPEGNAELVTDENELQAQQDHNATSTKPSPPDTADDTALADQVLEEVPGVGIEDEEILTAMFQASKPDLFGRIQDQIEKVRNESFEEAIHNLYQVNMFFWPGGPPLQGRIFIGDYIPLPPDIGDDDTKAILSNRRFLKVYEELSNMPVDKASALINKDLNLSFEQYLSVYGQDTQINSDGLSVASMEKLRAENPKGGIAGPGWISQTKDESKMTLLGIRFKVLSLLWIAGALELTVTQPVVQKVVSHGISQRDALYGDTNQSSFYKYEVLRQASLYNRQILITALFGTSGRSEDLYSEAGQIALERTKLRSTVFDATVTEYDLPVRSYVMQPDYTRGELHIYCCPAMNDETFDKAVSLHSSVR
jgi:hypothetical protein